MIDSIHVTIVTLCLLVVCYTLVMCNFNIMSALWDPPAGSGAEPGPLAIFSYIQIKSELIFGHRCVSILLQRWTNPGHQAKNLTIGRPGRTVFFQHTSLKIWTVSQNPERMVTLVVAVPGPAKLEAAVATVGWWWGKHSHFCLFVTSRCTSVWTDLSATVSSSQWHCAMWVPGCE